MLKELFFVRFLARPYRFFLLLVLCCAKQFAAAQITAPPPPQDTVRQVEILRGNSLREKMKDTVSFQTIAGDVLLKEALTLFYCDSAAINKTSNVMEAFGNVHINQQDSIHTYAQYLQYIGKERLAHLKKNVRLTDKKGTLYTEELDYDLKTNIGNYRKGGRVVNGKTTLTSEEGTYYGDTKDVYFKKKVHLVDPKYDITTDSLLYNTQSQVATFITLTHIASKDGTDIYTTSGNYDLKNGKAYFGNRTVFKDSTRVYVADNVAIDETSKTAQLEGNAVIRDSINGYTVLGGQIFVNQKNQTFLATRKPVLIFKGEGNDSTFVAADTLFSGVITKDSTGKTHLGKTDTLKLTTVINSDSLIHVKDSIIQKDISDSLKNNGNGQLPADTTLKKIDSAVTVTTIQPKLDTLTPPVGTAGQTGINLPQKDSAVVKAELPPQLDTSISLAKKDSAINKPVIFDKPPAIQQDNGADTTLAGPVSNENEPIEKDTTINISKDSAIRYFQAFHHVRIFNDSIQAVCDSLFYSSADSIFRLYTEPLVFSNKSQIAGDTIYLYTKNKKADRVYVFDKGILINELNKQMYNQIAGRTLNGYFKDGVLDYMRVKGSPAESVFYPQDEDSAYTGMNRCKGDVIDIYFVDKTVNKVKFVNDVDGALYPMNQVPDDQKRLTLFKWQDARRPKNKLELFE